MVYQTHDMEAVSNILNHPRVFGRITDDCSPDHYEPVDGFYVMNEAETGVVRVDPVNGICCSVHIATLPILWGGARRFAKEAIEWFFENTTYQKIIALIPEFNGLAIGLCDYCGFEKEGIMKKSYLKDYHLYDMVLLGLTKSDFGGESCHQ